MKKKKDDLDGVTLKEFIHGINLNNSFPGYFSKWIFRTCFVIMFVLFLLLLQNNDWSFSYKPWFYCEEENVNGCINPMYSCTHPLDDMNGYLYSCPGPEYLKYCNYGVCDVPIIAPGEGIGVEPKWIYIHFKSVFFGLIALSFIFNHIFYLQRKWDEKKVKKK